MILRLNQLVNRTNVQKHYRSDGSRITVSKKRKVVLIWSSEAVGVRVDPFARKRQVVQIEGAFNPGGEWTSGNSAIRDQADEGYDILLFEPAPSDTFRFLGRFGYLSHEEMDIQRPGGRGTRPVFRLSTVESWLELSLKSADQTLVDSAARAVTKVVTQYQAESWGPIPLPSKKGQYKSKDETMVDTVKHRRRLWLRDPQPAMIAELSGITLPGGVDVELKQSGATALETEAAPAS